MPHYSINTISRNPATWARLALREYLRECKRRARDFRPIWPRVLPILYDNMAEVFEKEGAVDGEPRWKDNSRRPIRFHGKVTRGFAVSGPSPMQAANPSFAGWNITRQLRLSGGRRVWMTYFPSYAQWKAINYPGRKIMELTGKLRRQLTGVSDTAYQRRTRRTLSFGTNYNDFFGVPGRPRSGRDRTRGADLGGVLNDGRENYYPMEPREIFRVTEANLERIEDIALDHITGTVEP